MNVDWQSTLKRLSIFTDLDKKEIDHLIDVSDEKEYSTDDVIVREGERGNSLFIIGFGTVNVVLPWRGEKTLHLTTLNKGEYFGEVALFEKPARRSATIVAAERCIVLEIDGTEFISLTKTHPEIVMEVIENVTSRLRDMGQQVIKVKLRDMDEKIDTLSTRLEAELRATSATLDATQTVFDQTSRRANEIIQSAERSRSRLTFTASILGTGITSLVAVFGFVGFSQLQNVTQLTSDIETKANGIIKTVDEIEALNVKDIMKNLQFLQGQIISHYKKIVLPQFSDVLIKDTQNAGEMYKAVLQLHDHNVTDDLFQRVNMGIFQHALIKDTSDSRTSDKEQDTELIEDAIVTMLKTNKPETPRQVLLSDFAILLAYTIDDDQDGFNDWVENFKNHAQEYKDFSLKDELPFDIEYYKQLIDSLSSDEENKTQKKKQLVRVWRQMP
jgi:CRP/FNR family cyclic AMP-dependent transcriptional regulator